MAHQASTGIDFVHVILANEAIGSPAPTRRPTTPPTSTLERPPPFSGGGLGALLAMLGAGAGMAALGLIRAGSARSRTRSRAGGRASGR